MVRPITHLRSSKRVPQSNRWNSFDRAYHTSVQAFAQVRQMRYLAFRQRTLVRWHCSFVWWSRRLASTAPPISNFSGRSAQCRERNLHLLVNNARFLILPWIRIPNSASHILACCCEKRLPHRLAAHCSRFLPPCLSTFCEIPPWQFAELATKPPIGFRSAKSPAVANSTCVTNMHADAISGSPLHSWSIELASIRPNLEFIPCMQSSG